MTNKEIIIDGCDVSECEWYSKHREGYCGWHTPCAGDSCSYKLKWALQQYKAKEQECEFSNLRIIQLQETLKQYEEENTELKNQRDQWMSRCEQETKTKEFFEDRLRELGFKTGGNNDNQ